MIGKFYLSVETILNYEYCDVALTSFVVLQTTENTTLLDHSKIFSSELIKFKYETGSQKRIIDLVLGITNTDDNLKCFSYFSDSIA